MTAGVRVLMAVASLVIGVAIAELIYGAWLQSSPWERALALNIVVNRRVTYDATPLYGETKPIVYTRDAYGLRGSFGDPGNITILTVGGSTTDQRYISDGATWQDELERQLRASGTRASIANAGVDGHSTFGHLASYAYWFPLIPRLHPPHTILYVGINDLLVTTPGVPFEGSADGAATLTSRIKASSAAYRLYATTVGTLRARRLGLGHGRVDFSRLRWVDTPVLRHDRPVLPDAVAAFADRFMQLLGRVRTSGSRPICVTQPTMYYRWDSEKHLWGVDVDLGDEVGGVPIGAFNGVDYFYLKRQLDTVIMAACRNAGGVVVDLATEPWETGAFYDYTHMTPAGATQLGQRIAATLRSVL